MASRIYPPAPSPATGRRLSSRVGTLPDPTAALLCNFHEQKSMDSTDARGNLPAASRVLARAAVRGASKYQAEIRHPRRSSIHTRQAARAKCRIKGAFAINYTTRITRYANASPRMVFISTTSKSFAGIFARASTEPSPPPPLVAPQISVTAQIIPKIGIPRASSGDYKRAAY